jgi:two-component system, OmpR family, lantibiotic biosynthesis response regulator NisR/SpaR
MEGRLLVVDDDKDIVNLISDILEDEGFEIDKAYTGDTALQKIISKNYDLIILDIMLPGLDGVEICKKVRDKIGTPIILLTAKNNSMDKVLGFEFGADDYITKPFDNYELVARVKAHLRRSRRSNEEVGSGDTGIIKFKGIVINKNSYEAFINNKSVELSSREFQILMFMMENANKVLSREQIYSSIWGYDDFGDINTVTVHIKKLREKIDMEDKFIKTIWGTGYKFIGEKL